MYGSVWAIPTYRVYRLFDSLQLGDRELADVIPTPLLFLSTIHTHTRNNTQPPPPGVAPTAAQVAASQGQSVVMSQQRQDVWGGGSDGGYTIF